VNREKFGFGEGLFEQKPVEFWRERGACERLDGGCFLGQGRIMREREILGSGGG